MTAALGAPLLAVGTAATPAGADVKNTMTVTARDYTYVIDGKLRPGQAQVTFENKGDEPHIMALLKLKPGVTIKQIKKALNSNDDSAFAKLSPDLEATYGTPEFLTPGGESSTITELLKAGDYAMICFLADAEGTPHFAHGMIHKFKVSGKPVKPQAVDSDGTVVLTDTAIQVPDGPAPSAATIEVDNQGSAPHSFVIVQLNGASTIQDVDAFFDTYEGGPLPADVPGQVVSGVGDIPAGEHVYLSWKDLPPGRYGYASTSGDSESPEGDDVSKGLIGEFTVQ